MTQEAILFLILSIYYAHWTGPNCFGLVTTYTRCWYNVLSTMLPPRKSLCYWHCFAAKLDADVSSRTAKSHSNVIPLFHVLPPKLNFHNGQIHLHQLHCPTHVLCLVSFGTCNSMNFTIEVKHNYFGTLHWVIVTNGAVCHDWYPGTEKNSSFVKAFNNKGPGKKVQPTLLTQVSVAIHHYPLWFETKYLFPSWLLAYEYVPEIRYMTS